MMRIEVDAALRHAIDLLDDLFAGRARIHLLSPRSGDLVPVEADEPRIAAPGPLHDALATNEVVVHHVGGSLPAGWSPAYRAWMPRGDSRVVAARIEGGGEVVGVVSVVRSESTTVPVAEDRALVGALAARFGRTAAVSMARALAGGGELDADDPTEDAPDDTPRAPVSPPTTSVRGLGVDDIDWFDEPPPDANPDADPSGGPGPGPPPGGTAEPSGGRETDEPAPGPADTTDEPVAALDLDALTRSLAAALGVEPSRLAVERHDPRAATDPGGVAAVAALCEVVAPSLHETMPSSGLRATLSSSDAQWRLSLFPADLEQGWPRRPSLDTRAIEEARNLGALAQVVADPDLGWVVEVRVDSDAADNDLIDLIELDDVPNGAVDLMAASLGDTSNMMMLAVSEDGRVVFCNDEVAARLGTSVADLLGRPLGSARGPSGAWSEFDALFDQVDARGLAQATLAWPHPDDTDRSIRWTVSRSVGPDVGAVYLCFGVDLHVGAVSTEG